MSRDFHNQFVATEYVQDTMEDLIEGSLAALHSNFNDPGDVPVGPKRVGAMWCSNTSDNVLRIRSQSNTAWYNVYDFSNQEVFLKDGQVTSSKISSSARKASIVTGESISPSSCTLQAKFKNVAVPGCANELFELIPAFGRSGASGWQSMYTTRIYVPSDAGTLYVIGRLTNAAIRFVLGGSTSTSSSTISGPKAWSPEVWLDVSGKSGWQTFELQTNTSSPFATEILFGLSCRWEV